MPLELVKPDQSHAPELARIVYEAFAEFHERHDTPRDIPTLEMAQRFIPFLIESPDFFSVAAILDGKVVGSNFMSTGDPVAGLGPITVDPSCQSRGVGRALMRAAIDHARRRSINQVRLFQEAINTASLSLYTSVGFDWRDSAAVMDAAPAPEHDDSVRPLTPADLSAAADLAVRNFHDTRRHEVESAIAAGRPAFVRERSRRITGYFLPGFFGHGMAESTDDALALITQAARRVGPEFSRFFCPLSQRELFRRALAAGCRTVKVMSYMSFGPYTPPREVWMPSILC